MSSLASGVKMPSVPASASLLTAAPSTGSLLNAAKGAATSVAAKASPANLLKAAASGNIKGSLTKAANSAKNAATNAAATAAASQVPGGDVGLKMAKNLGIPSTTLLTGSLGLAAFFKTMDTKTMLILGGLGAIFLLILIGMIVFFTQKKTSNFQNVRDTSILQGVTLEETASSLGKQVKGLAATLRGKLTGKKEGFADWATDETQKGLTGKSPHADDVKLVNLQPLTTKHAGFVGPLDAGVFEEATSVKNTLAAGVRTFVFQIDYHEDTKKDTKLFPSVNEPCLLFRDDSGKLTSTNAGSIQKMSQALADFAFSDATPSNTDPIVIILYGARVPVDPVTDPKGYLAYCTKIATQLKPLAPFHLGMMANGDYHRQALQGQLFSTPFTSFEKKVIIISNFDTTLYRNVTKMGLAPYKPSDDLDYWTHAQIFKDDPGVGTSPSLGVTTVAPPTLTPRSKIYSLDTLRSVMKGGASAMSAWATKNKSVFTIVMPSALSNPTYEEIDTMINKLGLNVLPFDFFSFDVADTKRRVNLWKSNTWNLRPLALRVGHKNLSYM